MNKRKLIIIITSRITPPHHRFLQGLINGAYNSGCDTAVFSVFSENNEESSHQTGEEYIYDLINFERADGIFFDDSSFWCERMLKKTADIIKKKSTSPVLCLNSDTATQYGFYNLKISDKTCFSETVSHLIEKHNLCDIICLTGTKGTFEAEERLRGYLDIMKKHNLPVPSENIRYGDFWNEAAKKLASDIYSGKIHKPEAIACASDTMATALINALLEKKIRVPEDIAVTGFDASDSAFLSTPSLTTYSPPEYQYGLSCTKKLLDLIFKRDSYTPTSPFKGDLITNCSCGCSEHNYKSIENIREKILSLKEAEEKADFGNISEQLLSSSDINELEIALDRLTYLIDGYDRYFLCLNEEVFSHERSGHSPFSPQMLIALEKAEYIRVSRNISFKSANMLPALLEKRSTPDVFFFTPVHFGKKCYGFSAVSFKDKSSFPNSIYRELNHNISNALHFLEVRSVISGQGSNSNINIPQSQNIPIAPHWFFELISLMSKKENFTAGLPRMLEAAHMSQEHLTRVFKKYTGITPTQYINDLRLEYAATLIIDKGTEISDACFLSGFNNISHFYHQFKRKYGCSPKQYLAKMQK